MGLWVQEAPEVFFFSHTDYAVLWKSHQVVPYVKGFIVILVNSYPKAFWWKFETLSNQLPCPKNGFFLEVIANGKVSQHFKKGVVP